MMLRGVLDRVRSSLGTAVALVAAVVVLVAAPAAHAEPTRAYDASSSLAACASGVPSALVSGLTVGRTCPVSEFLAQVPRVGAVWARGWGSGPAFEPGAGARGRERGAQGSVGEAHVLLRVWQKGAEYLPPSRTSR